MSSDFLIHVGLVQLQLLRGDITQIKVDAIVNAANSALAGGGGVDGAIHRAGGPAIMEELDQVRKKIGRCQTGSAVATGAGNLPAKYVFHAVGPMYLDGKHGEPGALASCYTTCLDMAVEKQVRVISFPSISTGIYGYPVGEAAPLALRTIEKWVGEHPGTLHAIKLIQFSDADHQVYRRAAEQLHRDLLADEQTTGNQS